MTSVMCQDIDDTATMVHGQLERTLFLLDWLQDPDLRRKVTAGLNKGEARNTLARAVFFNRLGEIRDRSFEQQATPSRQRFLGMRALWFIVEPERVGGRAGGVWGLRTNARESHAKPVRSGNDGRLGSLSLYG